MKKLLLAVLASLGVQSVQAAPVSYIQSRETLQSGTTFFTSSGTANSFNMTTGKVRTSITWPDGTVQISSPSASGNAVLAATQTWTGTNNWTTPSPSTFTYNVAVGSLTVTGSSAGAVNFTEGLQAGVSGGTVLHDILWADVSSHTLVGNFNGGVSTYTLVLSSITPITGHFVTFGTPSWALGDGGLTSAVPVGPVYAVQYKDGSSNLNGSSNFQFSGTTVTIASSVTINSYNGTGTANNDFNSLVNIFNGTSSSSDGSIIFNVGTTNLKNQFYIPNGAPVNMSNTGAIAGTIRVGDPNFLGSSIITSMTGAHNYVDFYESGNLIIQSDVNADGGKDIILRPGTVEAIRVSTQGITVTSSITARGNVYVSSGVLLSGAAGSNGQVITSGGAGTIPTWTTIAGSGDMILASTQVVTGAKTYQSSSTFNGVIAVSTSIHLSGSTGTNGQVLTSGGAGAIPTWTTVSGGGGSTGGSIVASTQANIPYYSGVATNTLSGSPGISVTTITASSLSTLATVTATSISVNGTFNSTGNTTLGNASAQVFIPNIGSLTPSLQFVRSPSGGALTTSGIGSGDLPFASTNYVLLGTTLQSGSTFYVSSGTVNQLTLGTLTVSGSVTTSSNVVIVSSSPVNALGVTANGGNYGTVDGTSGGVLMSCPGTTGQGECVQIYSNAGAQSNLAGVLNIVSGTSYDSVTMYVHALGTDPENGIRIDGADYATLALIDTTRSSASKNGKFQFSSHNNQLRGERRNSANNAFDSAWTVDSSTGPGVMYVGPGYLNAVSTMDVAGGMSIGAAVAGVTTSPNNGLLVQGSILNQALTASLPVQTDANKNLVSSAIDLSGAQATGALAAARFPALTGDITTSAGALATTAASSQANIKTFTSSITITGAGGLANTYGFSTGTGTFYTTSVSTNAVIVKSTTNLTSFRVDNTLPVAGDFILSISSIPSNASSAIMFGVNSYGHVISSGTTISTATSCGTGPVLTGTDFAGTVTGGTGANGCTITFGAAFLNTPVCIVSQQSMSLVNALSYTESTTALTITQTGLGTGKIDFVCIGNKG